MKRILIVADRFINGGLETHILGEIAQLQRIGWEVHVVFGEFSADFPMPEGVKPVVMEGKMGAGGTSGEVVALVDDLVRVVNRHAINVIHVHGFYSLIPGMIAAQAENIPLAITLHGPVFFQCFYNHVHQDIIHSMVLPNASLVVVVSEEVGKMVRAHVDDAKMQVLPNSVDFKRVLLLPEKSDPRFLVVSRLDADKIDGILDFVNKARDAGICGLVVAGSGSHQDELRTIIDNTGLKDFVEFSGFCDNVPELMRRCAGVAGMGRVVLEALSLKKTTILVGYDGVKGVVDCGFMEQARLENFSGRGQSTIDAEDLRSQLQALSGDALEKVYSRASEEFDEQHVWGVFSRHIANLAPVKKNVLYDIYRAIKGNFFESKLLADTMRIDSLIAQIEAVTRERDVALEDNMSLQQRAEAQKRLLTEQLDVANQVSARLQIQAENQQTILLRQRDTALENNALLQQEAEAQKKMLSAQLEAALEENRVLNGEIEAMFASASWKMTYPLRWLAGKVRRVAWARKNRYEAIKSLYWKLPEPLRHLLNGCRVRYVSKHLLEKSRMAKAPGSCADGKGVHNKPEWLELAAISSGRLAVIPCAFEFDELVNQRPINAAKYFAEKGYFVVFVAWQWSADEVLKKGSRMVWPGVFQVPLFEFVNFYAELPEKQQSAKYMLTFPARILTDLIYGLRGKGYSIVYDIMDEWEEFSKVGQAIWYEKMVEEALVLQSDVVTAVAPSLVEKFSNIRRDIVLIGNGYSVSSLGEGYRNISRKRPLGLKKENACIGYFGHLTDAWFDWNLLFDLAKSCENVRFEIIGYGEPEWVVKKAKSVTNVKLVGKVLPAELHAFVRNWDGAIIPFCEGRLADAVDPIKIYEYVYFGLSVFVVGMMHLAGYPSVNCSARDKAVMEFSGFLHSVNAQLVGDDVDRDEFLDKTTWHARFDCLMGCMDSKLMLGDLYAD